VPRSRSSVTTTARRLRPPRSALAALVLLLLGGSLTACSGADDAATGTSGDAAEAPATDPDRDGSGAVDLDTGGGGIGTDGDADRDEMGAAPDDDAARAPTDPPPAELAALGRERIRTAWITLEFDDPDGAVDRVASAAEEHGGFVALADLARDDRTGELGGTVTVRVPSDRLLPALEALEEIADDAPIRRIEEQDVGAQLTDLRARLANLIAYERELRALLTEIREATSDPDDLLPVVERLQSVRSDIDRLRAQRIGLEDRVALSTITVTLRPTPTEAPIVATSWTPLRTLEEALAATGGALASIADVAIWLVVTALPVLVVLAGPPVAVWWWLRRRRVAVRPTAPPPPVG
jgi:hypothetical protein